MKRSGSKRNLFAMAVIALLLTLAMPATSFGKDRGRHGRGRDNRRWKCGKFVNCHDARDGRWDSRGRRQGQFGRFDDLARFRRARLRDRNFNNEWFFRNRNNLDRDFARDDSWRNRERRISRRNLFVRRW